MKMKRLWLSLFFILILCTTAGCSDDKTYPTEYKKSPSPKISELRLPESPGDKVITDNRGLVQIDFSNASKGYLQAKLLRESDKRVRIGITKDGVGNIAYDLTKIGEYETFPFERGSGSYVLKVFLNISGKKYAAILSQTIDVQLENEQLPFLYPNQVVNYNENSEAIQKAFELTKKDDTVLKRIATLYHYVVDHVSYDEDKAVKVKDIYVLPIVDETLDQGKGICFDYAALLTSMLRSQQIPTRLVTGNTTIEYHAWVEVYIEGKGWITPDVLLDEKKWSRMDPTFASSGVDYKDGYEDKYYY